MHDAMFFEKFKSKTVKCTLCPHYCLIQDNKHGACAIRKNVGGKLFSLVYGRAVGCSPDPIEKKPLYHFFPGTRSYSYATAGCNFKCSFCQNWNISQVSKGEVGQIIGDKKSPSEIVRDAISMNCKSVAMTYNEPSIQFEYALDVAKEAKSNGLSNVFVSNGYITKDAINEISKYLDAINIDLKSFNDEFYKKVCGARLLPVLDAIKYYYKKGVWLEITTLIIPEENDSVEELKKIAQFIASIDKNIPWHISRFHPDFEMTDKRVTPLKTLLTAYHIGQIAGLNYIYLGNIKSNEFEHTVCPNCKEVLIGRSGYLIIENNLIENKCKYCSQEVHGIF